MDRQQTIGESLVGRRMPHLSIPSTDGGRVELSDPSLGDYVLFVYPRTGRPDRAEAIEWALIPGAKGCTAESCEFRDLATDFAEVGFSIFGMSTQTTADQREAVDRLHLPYPLLSDPAMELGRALGLGSFTFAGEALYSRCTLVIRGGEIVLAEMDISDAAAHPRHLLAELQSLTSAESVSVEPRH